MTRRRAAVAAVAAVLSGLAAGACASDDSREDLGTEVYLANAQAYVDGGHFDQALAEFRRGLEVDPASRKALLGEASCLYWLGMGETAAAGANIELAEEKIEALDPEAYADNAWKVALYKGMIHARLADLWGRKADLARKAAQPEQPDPANPGDRTAPADAVADLKTAEESRDRHEAVATRAFETVLAAEDRMAKNNLTALFYLASRGALRAQTSEDYAAPLDYFRRYAVEVDKSKKLWVEMKKREPDLAEVYEGKLKAAERQEVQLRDLVANIYFKQRRHEESIAELDRVVALDPYRAAAFFNRGRNEEELGRYGSAADDYRRFLMLTDLRPNSPLVQEASERKTKCEDMLREKLGK
jgi:tetratricopeptide (TPR) repeat protein